MEQAARLPECITRCLLYMKMGIILSRHLMISWMEVIWKKFDRLSYSLDDYFDFDADETGN